MVTAAEYEQLVSNEQTAAAAVAAFEDGQTTVLAGLKDKRAVVNDAYRAADAARHAAFLAWNADVKQHAIDAATAAHTAHADDDEAFVLGHMIAAARDVYAYMGAPTGGQESAAMQFAMRAVTMACGKEEEHHTLLFGEQPDEVTP